MKRNSRNKRYAASSSRTNKHPVLWLLTGLLIGIFICSLTFLKKKPVIIDRPEQQPAVTTAEKPSKQKLKIQDNKKSHVDSTEQYDFYTMLPKMQSNQTGAQPAVAAPPPAKPTKPLAVAEQSMLSPGTKPDDSTEQAAPADPTPQVATHSSTPTPTAEPISTPTPAKKYTVVAGDFNHYEQADAQKAELVLAGITHAKIESYSSNGTAHYRLNLGNYPNKAAATKIVEQLKSAQLNGSIIEPS